MVSPHCRRETIRARGENDEKKTELGVKIVGIWSENYATSYYVFFIEIKFPLSIPHSSGLVTIIPEDQELALNFIITAEEGAISCTIFTRASC